MSSLLMARNLTMSYPGVRALGGVDFDLRAGEIHALCGENGAGKSTLIKILCGVIPHGAHSREGGAVLLDGAACRFAGPGDALRAGLRVIHQELALCPDLTVAENVFLGAEPLRFAGGRAGPPDDRLMHARTRALLDGLGLPDLDPQTRTGALPVGLRQMVEIARALRPSGPGAGGTAAARVLILDEPTSALSARETARLLTVLRRLRGEGMGLLYISHHLDEVFELADRVTVLRNGDSAGTLERAVSKEAPPAAAPFDAARVVSLMTGTVTHEPARPPPREPSELSELSERSERSAPHQPGDESLPLLSVRDWSLADPANPARRVVDDVSFDVRAGEILGFAGLMGAGRTELVESLCGLFPGRATGTALIDGRAYVPRDAARALRRGLALVGEDRRGHGLFPDKSVRVNMTISSLRAFCRGGSEGSRGLIDAFDRLGWFPREARERDAAREQIAALRLKTPDPEFPAGNLSGGNQQKALIARALLTRPKILILDEPTRGIDVGAKEEIHALIERLAADGLGVLLVSSETEELLRLAHRVVILRAGRVAAQRPAATLNPEDALALAAGGVPPRETLP